MNKYKENKYLLDDDELDNEGLFSRRSGKNKNYGIILTFLFAISGAIFKRLKNGFFGYIFSDLYVECNEKWRKGFIYNIFGRKKFKKKVSVRFAKLYEKSIAYNIVAKVARNIIQSFTRVWGIGLLTFGFMVIFSEMMSYYLYDMMPFEGIIVGAFSAVLSIPLMVSKKRIGESMLAGGISRHIITQILCLDESKFEKDESASGGSFSLSFAIASILGALTFLINPMIILGVLLTIIGFVLIMSFPELGITAVILLIPLSNIFENPSIAILVVIVPTVFSYLFKFLRSKRVMRFELLDVFVLVFGALTLFGGIFTRGDISSLQGAAAYAAFLSIYFLIVNSYIRKTWIYRGIKLIVISTAIVALVGIIEGGVTEAAWIDASMFADITERVSAFLGNPNMLGVYFVIVFPLIIAEVVVSRSVFAKIGYFLCAVTVLVCTVLTWSRGAWLGLIIGVLVFMLIYNYRSFWLMVGAVMTLPIWVTFLPDSIIRRFMSIFTMSDSSVIYRFNTWRGVLSMIADNLFGGIGVGESAFGKVYPFYALEGTEGVMHSHSIYLQILLALGIIGALVFGLIIFSYIQKCFVTLKYKDNKRRSKSMIAAGIASITGALVVGLTDHIWYNYRVFLIFWVVMALTVALTKINEREKAKREANEINNSRSSDLDIYF